LRARRRRSLRFAYVKTGDRSLDETTAAGLFGLSYQLGQRTSVEPGTCRTASIWRVTVSNSIR
jgi:hypothetical protein